MSVCGTKNFLSPVIPRPAAATVRRPGVHRISQMLNCQYSCWIGKTIRQNCFRSVSMRARLLATLFVILCPTVPYLKLIILISGAHDGLLDVDHVKKAQAQHLTAFYFLLNISSVTHVVRGAQLNPCKKSPSPSYKTILKTLTAILISQ